MSYRKADSPASEDQIEQWLNSFDETELSRHGWSRFGIKECFERYEYIYNVTNSAVISLILYQILDSETLEIVFLATVPYARLTDSMRSLFAQLLQDHSGGQIWLECREDNVAAIQLYRKLGLKETGRRAKYYRDGTTAILFNF